MFGDSYNLSYYVLGKNNGFVYFEVVVNGYAKNESWRGHICYKAFYRVRDNGDDLRLLYKDAKARCS